MAKLKEGSTIKKGSADELIATVNDITRLMPDSSGVTSGSNTNGRWIRFSNGTQICWNSQNHGSLALTLSWGSLYGRAVPSVNNFPVSFTVTPTVIKSITSSSHTVIEATLNPAPTASHPGGFEASRGTAATVSNLTTHYIAIGRWK